MHYIGEVNIGEVWGGLHQIFGWVFQTEQREFRNPLLHRWMSAGEHSDSSSLIQIKIRPRLKITCRISHRALETIQAGRAFIRSLSSLLSWMQPSIKTEWLVIEYSGSGTLQLLPDTLHSSQIEGSLLCHLQDFPFACASSWSSCPRPRT